MGKNANNLAIFSQLKSRGFPQISCNFLSNILLKNNFIGSRLLKITNKLVI